MLNEQNKLYALITLCIFSALIFIITQATVDMYKKKKMINYKNTTDGTSFFPSFPPSPPLSPGSLPTYNTIKSKPLKI